MRAKMQRSARRPSTLAPLSTDQIREAERNVERCLEAVEERGETGLQVEMDRIFPTTVFKRVPLPGLSAASNALLGPPLKAGNRIVLFARALIVFRFSLERRQDGIIS
jgi:hypothetical protein